MRVIMNDRLTIPGVHGFIPAGRNGIMVVMSINDTLKAIISRFTGKSAHANPVKEVSE
jgi:hypothetical protein